MISTFRIAFKSEMRMVSLAFRTAFSSASRTPLGLGLNLCFSLLSGYSTASTKTRVGRKDSSIERKAPDTDHNPRCSQQQAGVEEEAVSFVDALYSPAAGHDEH